MQILHNMPTKLLKCLYKIILALQLLGREQLPTDKIPITVS